ncbi:YhjD/YihY/BrkB family envelope integrity protein [Streptomyces sp. NPDC001286]
MQSGTGTGKDGPDRPSRRAWRRKRTGSQGSGLTAMRERAEKRFPVITHLLSHLISVNVFDSATRLAAQTFLTAVPLLFVVASIAPASLRQQFATSLHDTFGLSGSSNQDLAKVLLGTDDPSDELRQTTGVVSGLMVLISATACSRAMQRLCERAWSMPKAGARVAAWRWVAWLATWMLMFAVQGSLRNGFGLGLWLGVPLLLLGQTGIWWWTQHLLLAGRMPWLPLLPASLLTGTALTVVTFTASLYVPRALNHSLDKYGSLGAVFTLLSWLITLCVIATLCMTAGAVIAREPWAAHRLGTPGPQGTPSDRA